MMKKFKLALAKIKNELNSLRLGFWLSCYLLFGGDKPLHRKLVKPLYYLMRGLDAFFGVLSSLMLMITLFRALGVVFIVIPVKPLISACRLTTKVAHAAMKVEMQEQQFA